MNFHYLKAYLSILTAPTASSYKPGFPYKLSPIRVSPTQIFMQYHCRGNMCKF